MYETYVVPVNFTDAGKLFGLFEIRNAVEAVILGIPMVFLCAWFLPLAITAKIIATLIIIVPTVGFALIGIRDDSLSRYLICLVRHRMRGTILTYKGEVNYYEFERNYFWREG